MDDKKNLVAAVKQHAKDNYEKDGWDYVIECLDDNDILFLIGDAATEETAIAAVGDVMKERAGIRADIQSEVF